MRRLAGRGIRRFAGRGIGRLARDVLLMAIATGISRVFGLAREAAIADRFGASAAYDAFLIAFFVPHFLRSLLAEGALSTAFVPIYTKLRIQGEAEKPDHQADPGTTAHLPADALRLHGSADAAYRREDADRFASNLLSLLLLLFPVTVVAGILLAPIYVPFLASGFPAEKLDLAIVLARFVFPFIAFVGLAAVFMGILNAQRRFFSASFAPVWFNVGMIVGVLVATTAFPSRPIYGLAAGVLIGGAGQLLSLIPALRATGFRFRFHLLPLHPGVLGFARRMAPAVIALAVAQINLLVDNKIASHLPDGGIASLQYAMRLFQLPLGVFAVSIATALLPRLSAATARGERGRFSRYLGDGFASTAFVLLPAMVGLLVIGRDLIRLLFEHGSFGPAETVRTTRVLFAYLIGLLPYGLVYIQTRACYALGRTALPVIAAVCAVGVNVALDLALVGPLREAGLALATAAAGLVNAAVLLFFLRATVRWDRRLARTLGTVVLGVALLAGVAYGTRRLFGDGSPAVAVAVPTVAGVLFYALYARLTGLWTLIGGFGQVAEPRSNE